MRFEALLRVIAWLCCMAFKIRNARRGLKMLPFELVAIRPFQPASDFDDDVDDVVGASRPIHLCHHCFQTIDARNGGDVPHWGGHSTAST